MLRSFRGATLVALALAASSALAQFSAPLDPDWRESEAPPPPALRTEGLIALEMPGSSLRWGVDPRSIVIGADRIVRYVVVAQGAGGAVNGIYEGVHCKTGEVKVYARHTPGAGWTPVTQQEWKKVHDVKHSLVIARTGVCLGNAPNSDPQQIARDLGRTANQRFEKQF